jgi:hypothetical protein
MVDNAASITTYSGIPAFRQRQRTQKNHTSS